MTLTLVALLLGFGVSLLSGLLGIGGGIVMAPALLYLPPLLGLEPLSIAMVSGLTVSQGLFASIAGAARHHKHKAVNRSLVLWMGTGVAVSALSGAFVSKGMDNELLLAIFAGAAGIAAVLMLLPGGDDSEVEDAANIDFNKPRALAIALSVGFFGGLLGQPGSFLLIPLMILVLKLPTRVAIGSNLAIVIFSAGAGFTGKLATGQIDGWLAVVLVAGSLPGAQIGSVLSRKTHPRSLRRALAIIIAVAAIGMGLDVLDVT